MSKKSKFKICQGFYINPETKEKTICKVSKYCERNHSNYTQVELLELLGHEVKPEVMPLYQPSHKPNDTGGCPSFINNSDRYMKRYEKHLKGE